MLVPSTSQFAS